MIKQFLALALLSFGFTCATAQSVISAASFTPQPGEAFIRQQYHSTGEGTGAGGAGLTWNFGTPVPIGSSDTTYYTASSPAGIPVFFPSSNIVSDMHTSVGARYFTYFKSNTDSIYNQGYYYPAVSSASVAYFNGVFNTMKFPFSYGNSFSDMFQQPQTCGSDYLPQYITYDAYGTILLNGNTYSNVSRIKTIVTDSSLDCASPPVLNKVVSTYYNYYVPGYHFPLITLHQYSTGVIMFSISSPLVPESVTDIAGNINALQASPNPATGNVTFSFNTATSQDCVLQITDIMGRQVGNPVAIQGNNTQHTVTLDVSNFYAGIYVATITGLSAKQRCNFVVGW